MVNSLFTLGPYARSVGGKPNSALRLSSRARCSRRATSTQGLADAGADGKATAPLPAPPVTTLPVADMAPRVRTGRAACRATPSTRRTSTLQDGWDVTGTRAAAARPGVVARRERFSLSTAPLEGSESASARRPGGGPAGGPSARGSRSPGRPGALVTGPRGITTLVRAASARADALVGGCDATGRRQRRRAQERDREPVSHALHGVHSTVRRCGRMVGSWTASPEMR